MQSNKDEISPEFFLFILLTFKWLDTFITPYDSQKETRGHFGNTNLVEKI